MTAKQLARIFLSHESEMKLAKLLEGLLAPKELEDLLQRVEIVRLLKAGHSQRAVARTLGVGIATVSRGARELSQGHFQHV